MMTRPHSKALSLTLAAIVACAAFTAGCDNDAGTSSTSSGGSGGASSGAATTVPAVGQGARDVAGSGAGASAAGAPSAAGKEATATIEPSKAPGQDKVAGTVRFTAAGNGIRVHAEITGLTPNGKHGFHIHEKGDLSAPDLTSAGAHFNPGGHKHGGPTGSERHGGDLGNLEADATGKATYDATIQGLTLDEGPTGILGKSVIIHEKADDLKSDPSGNSGARIAGGLIKAGGK